MKIFFRITSIIANAIAFVVLRAYEVPFLVATCCIFIPAFFEFMDGAFSNEEEN